MDQTDRMRRTAAADMMSNFNDVIAEYPMKVRTAIQTTALWFVDDAYITHWNKYLSSLDKQGKDTLSPHERRVFIQHLNLQFHQKLNTLDPLTRTFAMSYNANRKGVHWAFPNCLLWNFDFKGASQGVYGCIDGVPRSGKTSFACLLMPMFHNLEIEVITNIAIKNPPPYIHIKKTLFDVAYTIAQMFDAKKRWVLILDETATFVDKKTALSKSNIDFENLARFIGKMGGRLLMISHNFERDIPTRIQDWTTERFTKTSKTEARVLLVGEKFKFSDSVKGIPDSPLKYSTEDITSLKFDISIRRLLERIQTGEKLLQVLEDMKEEREQESLKDKIKRIAKQHPDWEQKQIAKEVGCTQANVSYHLKNI